MYIMWKRYSLASNYIIVIDSKCIPVKRCFKNDHSKSYCIGYRLWLRWAAKIELMAWRS